MFSSKPFTFIWFIKNCSVLSFFRFLSRSSAHSMHESCPVLHVSWQYPEPWWTCSSLRLIAHCQVIEKLKENWSQDASWPENVKKRKKERKRDREKEECKWLMSISRFRCFVVVTIIICTAEVLFLLRIWAHRAAAGHVLWFALYKWKAGRDRRMT